MTLCETHNKSFYDEDYPYRWEFKNKTYPHFDSFFCEKETKRIIENIRENSKIDHGFYPFIIYSIPKYRRDKENGRIHKDRENCRHIMHTARIDSNIYSYYRTILMNEYEKLLKKSSIDDCVIAYRKIPSSDKNRRGKCNLHFSSEAIEYIKSKVHKEEVVAIAMDIKGFFDNLDHKMIKQQWLRVMNFKNGMPDDHFKVFRNITRYSYIECKKIEYLLNKKIDLNENKKKKICSNDDFKNKIVPSLLKNEGRVGIPQGTSISDVIANMYMIDFDIKMKNLAEECDGYYRRYSDDILFISHPRFQLRVVDFIKESLKDIKLAVNDKKTIISKFCMLENKVTCITYQGGKEIKKPFEYLGLSFDGDRICIRQSTISSFYRKLKIYIRVEVEKAYSKLVKKGINPNTGDLLRNVNFEIIRNKFMVKKNKKEGEYGNFHTYIQLASKVIGRDDLVDFRKVKKFIEKTSIDFCNKIINKRMLF